MLLDPDANAPAGPPINDDLEGCRLKCDLVGGGL